MVLLIVELEVADQVRGLERLLEVALLEDAAEVRGVGPVACEAVSLELRAPDRVAGSEQTELGLDRVPVLVGEDVRDGEVTEPVALLRAVRVLTRPSHRRYAKSWLTKIMSLTPQ